MDLMRFRISSYWWISKNDFVDVEPQVEGGQLQPRGFFIEDILSLEHRRPIQGILAEPDYLVDLGWYPDQDPTGKYRLVLLGNGWDDILATLESPDRFLIRDTMERWMSQIDRAKDRDQLVRWLKKDA
jgi:hypothetical protein